jgi:hypothetical protein
MTTLWEVRERLEDDGHGVVPLDVLAHPWQTMRDAGTHGIVEGLTARVE